MSHTLMRSIPYIEAKHVGRKQKPKTISLHLSETTSDRGAALGVANYWHSYNSPHKSCHYVVDEDLVFQCVPDDRVALSSKFDARGTISINVCAMPTFDHTFWYNSEYASVLENTARLVAQLSKIHSIPVRYVDLLDNRRIFTRGGIMVNVRGAWPTDRFLDMTSYYKNQGGA